VLINYHVRADPDCGINLRSRMNDGRGMNHFPTQNNTAQPPCEERSPGRSPKADQSGSNPESETSQASRHQEATDSAFGFRASLGLRPPVCRYDARLPMRVWPSPL
jgi:hypothetical protein